MSKSFVSRCICFALFFLINPLFATTGRLFDVRATGPNIPATNVTLCLNVSGYTPLSCERHEVSRAILKIRSTAHHVYTHAGIKINRANFIFSPLYKMALKSDYLSNVSPGFVFVGPLSNKDAASGALEDEESTEAIIDVTSTSTSDSTEDPYDSSELILIANGDPGTMTIHNYSETITAMNIAGQLDGTILNGHIIQDAADCASLAPGSDCQLTFTSVDDQTITLGGVSISGDNTSTTDGYIIVKSN